VELQLINVRRMKEITGKDYQWVRNRVSAQSQSIPHKVFNHKGENYDHKVGKPGADPTLTKIRSVLPVTSHRDTAQLNQYTKKPML
jgi:hypothetical protein